MNTVNTNQKVQEVLLEASNKIVELIGFEVVLTASVMPIEQKSDSVASYRAEKIYEVIEDASGITKMEIISTTRKREIVNQRVKVASFMFRFIPSWSLKRIGQAIGGRDHSTVIHERDKCQDYMDTEPEFKKQYLEIEAILRDKYNFH